MRHAMAGFGFAVLASCLGAAPAVAAVAPDQKPDIAVKTRIFEGSVTIDKALLAHPGLQANLLAEGQRELAKWRASSEKERRETPEFFQEGRRWTYERSYRLRSLIGRYVSILRDDGTYMGGAHPN